MKKADGKEAVVYQTKSGSIELRSDVSRETVWATQAQIAQIFDIERSVVTKHIGNILKSEEINEKSNVQKMHIANSDKPVAFYSLDIMLAVGYRANSARAIQFRKWATKTLREHITRGYTVNRKRIVRNYDAFMKSVSDIRALLPEGDEIDPKAVLDLVKEFADTWVSLDAYDRDDLTVRKATKKQVKLTSDDLLSAIGTLREELTRKGEAGGLFASERNRGSVEGIVGNVMQSIGGRPVYPSVEERAAHLLYFMVKNHPFVDGNKRSGAFAFVWFLRKSGIGGRSDINPSGLTALTLLIAESDPKRKDQMIALVSCLLG
ncbi:MAG: virulence protein RhuM/Fic/DOC family protein [Candidatus Moranbacteria bacterium]|nr:virulence protein RhuM/Fic/DOC family protein [Candidatus Moranbacteria bacterium]